MKIFVSSVAQDFGIFRSAAAAGVTALGHQPLRAEDFGASPASPQAACLEGVRSSDAVVLLLGSRYGSVQSSGLSPTHEEYREARDTRPVLAFIQRGTEPEPQQREFIREVRGWEHGHFTSDFTNTEDLRDSVIRALHDYIVASEVAPIDDGQLTARARSLVNSDHYAQRTGLVLAVAGSPKRSVLRPVELEEESLRRFLLAESLTGQNAVLNPSLGTDTSIKGDTIQLSQDNGASLISLDEIGNLVVVQPAVEHTESYSGISALIEEVITERIVRALRFCAGVLDYVDPTQRLTHTAPVAALRHRGYLPWRTRAEHQNSPNAAVMGTGQAGTITVALTPPVRRRPALAHDTQRIAEDFVVRLRREVRQ